MRPSSSSIVVAVALGVVGCGSAPPQADTPPTPEPTDEPQRHGNLPSVSSEVGALDREKTEAAWRAANTKLNACFEKGLARVPYLAGRASFTVRVAKDGSTRYAFLKDSTLGDRETEACMLDVLAGVRWPRPVGGEEGIAEQSDLEFDPGGDERPPVDWSPEQLGKDFAKVRGALAKCRSSAGTGPLKVTLYVETDGRPKSVGVATSDEKGRAAVQCVADTLNAAKFPSPGSWAAKVTVTVD